MDIFEYHVLIVDPEWLASNKGGDASRKLTQFGSEGWQLVATIPHPGGTPVSLILQRRP